MAFFPTANKQTNQIIIQFFYSTSHTHALFLLLFIFFCFARFNPFDVCTPIVCVRKLIPFDTRTPPECLSHRIFVYLAARFNRTYVRTSISYNVYIYIYTTSIVIATAAATTAALMMMTMTIKVMICSERHASQRDFKTDWEEKTQNRTRRIARR